LAAGSVVTVTLRWGSVIAFPAFDAQASLLRVVLLM
jgi:hypothetical protein